MSKTILEQRGIKPALIEKTRHRRDMLRDETKRVQIEHSARRNDLLPRLRLEQISVEKLKSPRRKTRVSSPPQLRRITASIVQSGICVPIIIDAENRVIDGQGVVEAARELDLPKLPCVRIDHLGTEECELLRLAINRIGEQGEWDPIELREQIIELEEAELDVSSAGFTLPEIDIILQTEDSNATSDETPPEAPANPVTERGDLWLLDNHRLFCGDARDVEAYQALLDGEKASAVFTDPPYNIKIEGVVSGLGKVKHRDFAMASGEMSEDEFKGFLADFLSMCRTNVEEGSVIFSCIDWRQQHVLRAAAIEADLTHINLAIWDKGSGGMGALYRSAHELVMVFCAGDKPRTNNVKLGCHGRDRTNVWHYPGANRPGSSASDALHLHATPKPVEMVEDALLDVSERGDLILDPFMGSGTTLIACERAGRISAGIELEPRFVDVAIMRWEQLTGNQAINARTRLPFGAGISPSE